MIFLTFYFLCGVLPRWFSSIAIMKLPSSFVSGFTFNSSSEAVLHSTSTIPHCRRKGAWRLYVLLVLTQGGTLLISRKPSCMDDSLCCLCLYSPVPVVVRWKNTLFLGGDGCFKLKGKDRGFDDPDLSAGLTYMVKEGPYQKHLRATATMPNPVSFFVCYHSITDHFGADFHLRSRSSRGKPSTHETQPGVRRHRRYRHFVSSWVCSPKRSC